MLSIPQVFFAVKICNQHQHNRYDLAVKEVLIVGWLIIYKDIALSQSLILVSSYYKYLPFDSALLMIGVTTIGI